MPYRAIDIETGLSQSVEWFIRNGKKIGLCGYCETEMTIKNNSNPDKPEFFWHSNQNTNCETISKNGVQYQGLSAGEIDKESGKLMREKIQKNLYKIYQACLKLTNSHIFFSHFKKMVNEASSKGVWDYKGLTFNYVPYILLTFAEDLRNYFPDEKGLIPYRFIFQPSLKAYDDLWINPHLKVNAWKVKKDGEILEIIPISEDPLGDLEPGYFSTIKV
ncbi:hypothetical protein [Acinetobacter gyllenbergii]|uniref:hypothetical protein n=1 Tax=Acinetobacter gyllenbergii TaxID=134534 RepID=UPI003F559F22